MKKIVPGTVGTYLVLNEGKHEVVFRPLRVLKTHTDITQYPKRWQGHRGEELANAIQWLLSKCPPNIIAEQEKIEDRELE